MRSRIGVSVFGAAVAASAAAHALVLATFTTVEVGQGGPPAEYAEMDVVYDPSETPAPDAAEFEIGQPGGEGYATHDVQGRREQTAREAPQDQPSLSLDPVGDARAVDVPSTGGNAAAGRTSAEAAIPTPHRTASAFAAAVLPPVPPMPLDASGWQPAERSEPAVRLLGPAAFQSPVESPAGDEALSFQPAPTPTGAAALAARQSPAPGAGADPAPPGDSESDAFSVLGSVEFRAGRVTVQSGRQVKTRRPKVGLAGMVELAHRGTAEVELMVAVDRTGKVTDVDVVRSSGSNDIDQPCRVAMYEWWFEPKKDAGGQPVPDRFRFTLSFR